MAWLMLPLVVLLVAAAAATNSEAADRAPLHGTAGLVGGNAAPGKAEVDVPNVLLVLADDLGFGDPSFMKERFGTGENGEEAHARTLRTPNMDQLAAEGVALSDAHAGAPVCAPSRCTLMTGLHTGHCPIRGNQDNTNNITHVAVTLGSVMRERGLRTAYVGKWGLGTVEKHSAPLHKGFDEYHGQIDQRNCKNYYPELVWSGNLRKHVSENHNSSVLGCGGMEHLENRCVWSGDMFTRAAVDFMSRAVASKQPFFLFVSYTIPHAGCVGATNCEVGTPVPRLSQSRHFSSLSEWGLIETQFAAAVESFDQQLGVLLHHLDLLHVRDNSIVIVTSDNGAHNEGHHSFSFFRSSGPLQGFKRSLREGGHRVPFVVRWPNGLPKGKWNAGLFAFPDMLPTLAELVGPPLNEDEAHGVDGKSSASIWRGTGPTHEERQFYLEYCGPNEWPGGFGQMLRLGNLSFICSGPSLDVSPVPACRETPKVFDLSSDLHQSRDLLPQVDPRLVKRALNIMKAAHTPFAICRELGKSRSNDELLAKKK